jgi:acyl carrier protein
VRADGDIEYIGRIDDQVKIRGFRIELGEIEESLMRHPYVIECVVITREVGRGENQLIAYVVCQPGEWPGAGELREFLKHLLPEYSIPAAFVNLDELPRTSSGKVNRRKLPDPGSLTQELAGEYVAPQGPVEETLAEIWAELLEIERIGIYDNFFMLGGHSLLATQLVARMQRAFDMTIPLRKIFEAPTIGELAVTIEEMILEEIESMSEDESALPAIGPNLQAE